MISQTSKYALSILGHLVQADGSRCRSEDIARSTGIPANYLSKILNQLRKRGIVTGEKGWGGGFTLSRRALRLPIGEIVQIFDGVDSTGKTGCIFGLPECDANNPCPLHHRWEVIRRLQLDMLEQTVVEDLGAKKK